ncbi:MAG: hypothetical protein AB1416_02610 [Actinomycetota bacterium]
MAKAKRERRTSIRTLRADGGLDFLDRLDEMERQEKALQVQAVEAAPAEAEAGDDPQEDGEPE